MGMSHMHIHLSPSHLNEKHEHAYGNSGPHEAFLCSRVYHAGGTPQLEDTCITPESNSVSNAVYHNVGRDGADARIMQYIFKASKLTN